MKSSRREHTYAYILLWTSSDRWLLGTESRDLLMNFTIGSSIHSFPFITNITVSFSAEQYAVFLCRFRGYCCDTPLPIQQSIRNVVRVSATPGDGVGVEYCVSDGACFCVSSLNDSVITVNENTSRSNFLNNNL